MNNAQMDKTDANTAKRIATPTPQPAPPPPRNNSNLGALNGDSRDPFTRADADRISERGAKSRE